MPTLRSLLCVCLVGSLACGDDDTSPPVDAGPGEDVVVEEDGGRPGLCMPQGIRWNASRVDTIVGTTRFVRLSLTRDLCDDAVLSVSASVDGIVTVVDSVTIPAGESRAELDVTGTAVGDTVLTATFVDLPGTPDETVFTDDIDVTVFEENVPACEGAEATGMLTYDGELRFNSTVVGISLPEGAQRDDEYHVDEFMASVGCAPDQVPDGFSALGPAVAFGPGHARFSRELPLTIPVNVGLLPENVYRGQVRMSYTGPGVSEPRLVPVASPDFETNPGFVTFFAPRLGTYQAVVAPPVTREREFSYRGIMGVSMGSGGAGLIAAHNVDRLDFIGPLGGPVDWLSLMHYIRTYHLGGFCTEAEYVADMMLAEEDRVCGEARVDRTPPTNQLFEVQQDFEHWFYEDEQRGHGGTFDRDEYIRIFRDLAMMFGNPNTTAVDDPTGPNVLPPGIADSDRMREDADRCANPVVIESGYFDDEYNPEGTHPVITFCDGGELRDETGDRGQVDDRSGLALAQVGQRQAGADVDGIEIDAHAAAPLVRRGVVDRADRPDAGVVDEHIEASERGVGLGQSLGPGRLRGDVVDAGDRRVGMGCIDIGGDGLGRGAIEIAHHDAGAFIGEGAGDSAADAAGAAGDKRPFSAQSSAGHRLSLTYAGF